MPCTVFHFEKKIPKNDFKEMLAMIQDPIHPTEIFDCIAGNNKYIPICIHS